MDWFDLPAVQEMLKNLFQHHSSKASILQCSGFFMVQLPHLYMTNEKTIALTIWTFVNKMMSLLFNILSRFVIAFLPRSKHLLISRLQSPFAVILQLLMKAMAPHSSTLAWRIPGTGEPDGLPSMGSHRVGHSEAMQQQLQQIRR